MQTTVLTNRYVFICCNDSPSISMYNCYALQIGRINLDEMLYCIVIQVDPRKAGQTVMKTPVS